MSGCRLAGVVLTIAVAAGVFWGCRKERGTWTYEPSPPPPRAPVVTPPPPAPIPPPPGPVAPPAPIPPPPGPVAPVPPRPLPAVTAAGVQVLLRGPMHEAFAQPIRYTPMASVIAPRVPPPPIDEMPPEWRPSGLPTVWIPGYWAWDEDRTDFIWVSGIWRLPPPGTTWVPGYWSPWRRGYYWTPGFWMSGFAGEIDYLPFPPASLEKGPAGQRISEDYIWIPGFWYRPGPRYVWTAGFWDAARPNWVWVPSHYVWTPRGVIFVSGYWDYPLGRRGLLFAPLAVDRALRTPGRFSSVPTVVIEPQALTANLFARPKYYHYYFGDYYETKYVRLGIYPWYECRERREWYDPLYLHQEWRHQRDDIQWEAHERGEYARRRDQSELRPALTLADQQARVARLPEAERGRAILGRLLSEVMSGLGAEVRLEKVDDARRTQLGQQGKELRHYEEQRAQWESAGKAATAAPPAETAPPQGPARDVTPEKVRVPRSPILSGASEQPPPPPKPAPAVPPKPK